MYGTKFEGGVSTGSDLSPEDRVVPDGDHEYWLCGASEERIVYSMSNGMTIKVGAHLLLKFCGRMAALCTQDFRGPNGEVFKAGYWYAPYGKEFREEIRISYKNGATAVPLNSNGDWAEVRIAEDQEKMTVADLIAQCVAYMSGVTGQPLSPKDADARWKATYKEDYNSD